MRTIVVRAGLTGAGAVAAEAAGGGAILTSMTPICTEVPERVVGRAVTGGRDEGGGAMRCEVGDVGMVRRGAGLVSSVARGRVDSGA